MITRELVRKQALDFIDSTLKEVPGAMIEVKIPFRFDSYVELLTEKCNKLDIYAFSRGHKKWDVKDFIKKMTGKYCLDVLDQIEHRLGKSIKR